MGKTIILLTRSGAAGPDNVHIEPEINTHQPGGGKVTTEVLKHYLLSKSD